MRIAWTASLLFAVTMPVAATDTPLQEFLTAPAGRGVPVANPAGCTGGLRNDDGSYEGAVGYANAVQLGTYTMAFDIPAGFGLEQVCICWTRGPFNSGPDIDFAVVFYHADGEGPKGEPDYPGSFIGRVPTRAESVPEFQVDGVALYQVPVPEFAQGLDGRIHVGVEWSPFVDRQFYLCNDAEVDTKERPVFEGYSNVAPEKLWSTVSSIRPTYRAFGTVLYGNHVFAGDFECSVDAPGCI